MRVSKTTCSIETVFTKKFTVSNRNIVGNRKSISLKIFIEEYFLNICFYFNFFYLIKTTLKPFVMAAWELELTLECERTLHHIFIHFHFIFSLQHIFVSWGPITPKLISTPNEDERVSPTWPRDTLVT